MANKPEFVEFAWRGLIPDLKMAILLGSDINFYLRVQNYLFERVSLGIFEKEFALEVMKQNLMRSMRVGITHFEHLTRQDTTRYNALNRLKGVQVEGMSVTPIEEDKGQVFDPFLQALVYGRDGAKEEQQIEDKLDLARKSLKTVNVIRRGRFVELPLWLVKLRNTIIQNEVDLIQIDWSPWVTRQEIMLRKMGEIENLETDYEAIQEEIRELKEIVKQRLEEKIEARKSSIQLMLKKNRGKKHEQTGAKVSKTGNTRESGPVKKRRK